MAREALQGLLILGDFHSHPTILKLAKKLQVTTGYLWKRYDSL